LFQARLVADRIQATNGIATEIVVIKTSGDRLQGASLSEIGGKRLFVKEIEDALLSGDVDLAVHSSKDMPVSLPEGLGVGAVLPREDPRDALVLPVEKGSAERAAGGLSGFSGRIGTGSVRRVAQLRAVFPAASFTSVRGNLDTRLRKLDAGEYDLLVLAAAGLMRLGYSSRISATVPLEDCVPAPGQGIIAVEVRVGDEATNKAISGITDDDACVALEAERALVMGLGGGCQMPIGGIAIANGAHALQLEAIVISLDGARAIRYKKVGVRRSAAALGREVAEQLLRLGAADILNESHIRNPEPRQLT
jgi:hydroxymethylbilane synthase